MEADGAPQQPPARVERQPRRVVSVEVQQVEGVEVDSRAAFRSLLQALEAGLPARERDDLTVEHELRRRVGGERRRNLGKARIEAQVVSREQAHLAVAFDRDAADAIELSFEQPGRVGEALLGQDGFHRLDALRQRGRAQQPALVAGEPREGVTGPRSHLGIVCAWFV